MEKLQHVIAEAAKSSRPWTIMVHENLYLKNLTMNYVTLVSVPS